MNKEVLLWCFAGAAVFAVLVLNQIHHTLNPIAFGLVLALTIGVALFILAQAAHLIIFALMDYSKHTGLAPSAMGLLVLAVGTSLPDLSSAVFASVRGQGAIIAGAVMGANILNVTLITGVGLMFLRKRFRPRKFKLHGIMTFALAMLPILMGIDGEVSRSDGIALILCYVIYVMRVLYHQSNSSHLKDSVPVKVVARDAFIILGCLLALLLGGKWLISSFTVLSVLVSASSFGIGSIFLALATTFPEFAVSVKSFRHGHVAAGLANAIGSLCINATLVLGVTALISPFFVPVAELLEAGAVLFVALLLFFAVISSKHVHRYHGALLILPYFVFLFLQLF